MAELSNRRIGAKFPQFYTVDSRLQTFDKWPKDSHLQPRELAEAGFVYQGNGDCVTCYYCGVELDTWEPGDEAWAEHEKCSQSCTHVLLHKIDGLSLGDRYADKSFSMQNSGDGFRKDCAQEDILKKADFHDYKRLEEENKKLRHQFLCKTCLREKACIVFLPCGHLSACSVCAKELQNCNICQQAIKATVRAYCS